MIAKTEVKLLKSLRLILHSGSREEMETNLLRSFMLLTHSTGGTLVEYDGSKCIGKVICNNRYLEDIPGHEFNFNTNGPLYYVNNTGRPLFIRDILHTRRFRSSGYRGYVGESVIILPLQSDSGPQRYLTLHSPKKSKFSKNDFRLGLMLLLFARQTMELINIKALLPGLHKNMTEMNALVHNLRNIICPIYNYMLKLRMMRPGDPLWDSFVSNLFTASEHAFRIASAPLHSKDAGIHPEQLEVSDIIGSCLKYYMNSPIRFTFKSSLDSDMRILGYKHEIEQVLVNLIKNASEASDGLCDIQISLDASSPGSMHGDSRYSRYVCVSVKDNGSGIDPLYIDKIFLPGFTTKSEGSGIGLDYVFRTMQKHHGLISLTTEPGAGTEFRLFFPAYTSITAEQFMTANTDSPVIVRHL